MKDPRHYVLLFVRCCLLVPLLFLGGHIVSVIDAKSGKTLGSKMVYIDAQYRVDPVTITKVTVGDQQILPGLSTGSREDKPGTPFQADEDWLKNMSFHLKNRTNKVIVRTEIMLYFLGSSPSKPVATFIIKVGQRPEIDSFTSHGQKLPPEPNQKTLVFAPDQTQVIKVGDYVDEIQSLIEGTTPFSQVTRVALLRLQFYFDDGMRWNELVGFGVPDPDHPGQFTNMDRRTYFPGRTSRNWPPSE